MTKKRSRVSVASSILKVCSGGATKTNIVRRANLNFIMLSSYLDNLKNKGLLEEIPKGSGIIYRTTPKGLEWKKRFEQSVTLLDELQITA